MTYRVCHPKTSEAFLRCIDVLYRGAQDVPDSPDKRDALGKRPLVLAWLAKATVETLHSCAPPQEPRVYDWEQLIAAATDREDRGKAFQFATRVREAWNDVLTYESECAARVLEVMRAWTWAIDGAKRARAEGMSDAQVAEHEEHALRCRVFLDEMWGIRIAAPPDAHAAARVAVRLTRRYDLMPRNVREWSPE